MTRKNIFILLLLVFAVCAQAQTAGKGIKFEAEGTLFRQAVQKAMSAKKLIFVDCYTSWCGPCKMMARDVFTQEKVGNVMNAKYVNFKIDMEKGEGPELAKKWQVSAYPTFIIFNSAGQELGRFLGGSDADGFLKRVQDHSIDKGSSEMDARWNAGERGEQFLYDYLQTLGSSFKRDQCNAVAEELLKGKAETFASDDKLRNVFMRHLTNPLHPAAIYATKHPDELIKAVGDMQVEMKLRNMWSYFGRDLINETDGQVTLDESTFGKWVKAMDDCNVANRDEYRLNVLIKLAERQNDWASYVKYLEEAYNHPAIDVPDIELCKWMNPLMKDCKDMDLRTRAASLLQNRYDAIINGTRKPQTRAGNMMLSGNLTEVMPKLVKALKGEAVDFGNQPRKN